MSLAKGQLTLTVGLPLITGMNVRQFSGILAHEFGHLAQPSAMIAYYLVNTINYWFASRAYEPDSWDKRLEIWSEKANWHIAFTAAFTSAQFGIYLTRKLFSGLYLLNLKTTRFMSRHMEYDADAYESIISGSDQFKSTAIQLRKLSYANSRVEEINKEAWNENKLLKNLPSAIAIIADGFDESICDYIEQDMQKDETNAWDSHPADNDRIQHVLNRGDSGMLTDTFPVSLLCKDIKVISERVTLYTYKQMGLKNPEEFVAENAVILNSDDDKNRSRQALDSFFNNNFYGRFLYLEQPEGQDNKPVSTEQAITALRESMGEYAKLSNEYVTLVEQYAVMVMGETYINHGIDLEPGDFHLPSDDKDMIRSSINAVKESIASLDKKLKSTDQMFFYRIQHDAIFMSAEQLTVLKDRLNILNQMKGLSEKIFRLDYCTEVLEALLGNEDELIEQVADSIERYGRYCIEDASHLIGMSRNVTYGKDNLSALSDFIKTWCDEMPEQHNRHNPHDSLSYAKNVVSALKYHYYWTLADVCELAVSVEEEKGVAPIKLV